jgi:hypothetical protein
MASSQMPALNRITSSEITVIKSMFRMYDIKSTGKISHHYARKLLTALGFSLDTVDLPFNITLEEFLLLADAQAPLLTPSLPCSLYTYDRLVAVRDPQDGKNKITPENLSDFMVSLGRNPVPEGVATVLLSKMVDRLGFELGLVWNRCY